MAECQVKKSGRHEYYCSVELTLQVIGGKWKPIILYHLGRNGTHRFGELKLAIPNITQKMLTQQLRELEKDGVIDRLVYAVVPPKVEYSLTELGHTIIPVLQHLGQWGQQYEEYSREHGLSEVTA
ncbi:helix-turn-helix domain-containing protein [Maridesulfovibrio ferrireducens]|uniref:winged helix-turn-helix transcriptional regulator n=1 Tax=Maridesulfovibrio ferrireducens TaxID=246191 RepID=UPI001A2D94FE|nr:helix-turn-helix domain-containing protein [Maridesulfovibrio ferrireducens]MBI9111858.1 helix-turn-helix transcriptional regulator [Maridesulfovibrio ferrireducens]